MDSLAACNDDISNCKKKKVMIMSYDNNDIKNDHFKNEDKVDDDEDDDEDDDDDDDDEGCEYFDYNEDNDNCKSNECWKKIDFGCCLNCLFCNQSFTKMTAVVEHFNVDHKFNFSDLKSRFDMDCYSYICMINFIRRKCISPEMLMSLTEPVWLKEEYLKPVIQDDPWLMLDFEDLEPVEFNKSSASESPKIIKSENGLVTLSEEHFVQLQNKIKCLTSEVNAKEEALKIASDQIEKMKAVTKNLISEDSVDQNYQKASASGKLLENNEYFNGYSHFGIHFEMLSDRVRTMAYKNAIFNNSDLISDKIVLDVGCGSGILSMFAASAGAKKVFGVDQSDVIFNAIDIVRENNFSEEIELIHSKVEEAVLPCEKVDVIISEWMGYFLLFEGMLDSVIKARDRFLKTGGKLLPNRCSLYITGISDSENYDKILGFWSNVYNFKMSSLKDEVIREAHIILVQEDTLITTEYPILQLDLHTVEIHSTNFESNFILECLKDGYLTALCGYFDVFFDLPNSEILSTKPASEKTHWKQTVFFLKKPISVSKGSLLEGRITCQRFEKCTRSLFIKIIICGQTNEYYLS